MTKGVNIELEFNDNWKKAFLEALWNDKKFRDSILGILMMDSFEKTSMCDCKDDDDISPCPKCGCETVKSVKDDWVCEDCGEVILSATSKETSL